MPELQGTFETISELAITLTGFTGIVVIFARDRFDNSPEVFRIKALLYWSLGTAFLAHLPGAIWAMPGELPLWRLSHFAFALFHISVFYWTFAGARALRAAGWRPPDSMRPFGAGVVLLGAVVLVCELTVAAGHAVSFGPFFYLLALLWFLFLAAVSFVFLLLPPAFQQVAAADTAPLGPDDP